MPAFQAFLTDLAGVPGFSRVEGGTKEGKECRMGPYSTDAFFIQAPRMRKEAWPGSGLPKRKKARGGSLRPFWGGRLRIRRI